MDRETDACEVLSAMAASVTLPSSTTATSARRCRVSRSMHKAYRRSEHSISRPRRPLRLGHVSPRTSVTSPSGAGPTTVGGATRGLVPMLVSGASNQAGATVGAHTFSALGPSGVVAVRQLIAAAVLLPTVRPPMRRFTWPQWWPVLLLGVVFAAMNLSLYTAVDRIGLGLAVTLEFLGPLAVALAGTRRLIDGVCAAGAGV